MRKILVVLCILSFITFQTAIAQDDHPFKFDIQKTGCIGGQLLVPVMVKNDGQKHVDTALASCLVLDTDKKMIGTHKEYIVYPQKGGLKPGDSQLKKFVVPVMDCDRVNTVKIVVHSVKYRQ